MSHPLAGPSGSFTSHTHASQHPLGYGGGGDDDTYSVVDGDHPPPSAPDLCLMPNLAGAQYSWGEWTWSLITSPTFDLMLASLIINVTALAMKFFFGSLFFALFLMLNTAASISGICYYIASSSASRENAIFRAHFLPA